VKKIKGSIEILAKAVQEKQISGYALALAYKNQVTYESGGTHGYSDSGAIARYVNKNSLFDLASLTKIFSTSLLIHLSQRQGLLTILDPVQKYLPNFAHKQITIQHLLEHTSGLPAHLEFFKRYHQGEAALGDLDALKSWIYATPLSQATGSKTEYSDLGFMLLGFLLETIQAKPLAQIFHELVVQPLGLNQSGFVALPHSRWQDPGIALHFAPGDYVATELCPWRKKVMQGEVHDDNTWAMGGVAGHAGLFSTAAESLQILQFLNEILDQNKNFVRPDLGLRSSSNHFCQGLMVYPGLRAFAGNDFAGAVGHTGFVGTSAWSHPADELHVVLLTNRVHPSRTDTRWIETRLAFHQSLWNQLH